jgi:hypothetical protein
MTSNKLGRRFAPAILIVLAGIAPRTSHAGGLIQGLEFRGEAILPRNLTVGGTTVGGLSALAYDPATGRYRVLSDDKGQPNAARYYEATIDLADGTLGPGEVQITGVTTLKRPDGTPVAPNTTDTEGMARAPDGRLFISSEGNGGSPPFVKEFDPATGRELGDLALPAKFLPGVGTGIRSNLGFEALAATPSGRWLYTATENALAQDGPAASTSIGSPSRILQFDLETGQAGAEFLYQTDAIPGPIGLGGGLVELLALDDNHLIALERSLSATGYSARLYEVSLDGATDIRGLASLAGAPGIVGANKRLLLDLKDLARPLWNLEGMTFGPDLADGRRSLILVSDNNFNSFESTQFLAFAFTVVPEPPTASLALIGLFGLAAARLARRPA